MCFSEKASLTAFLVGMTSSLYCYSLGKPNDKVFGLFFAFVSLIQLIDYLLWKHQVCDAYNKMVSLFGMILNHLQPIILAVLLIMYKSDINRKAISYIIGVYLLFMIPYSLQSSGGGCTIKSKNPNFKWNNEKYHNIVNTIFMICLTLLFYYGFSLRAAILTVVTILFSQIFYSKQVGATWCFFAVGFPVMYALNNIQAFH